jgi:phosphoribosylamine--glycine ligase
MLVSAGYPGDYPKGLEIYELDKVDESIIFHAGTALNDNGDRIITAGGRVLAVTSLASTTAEALEKSYRSAAIVDYLGKTYRRDIGRDILK